MSIIASIFLGIIHGITEILPVSWTGHLAVLQNIFGLKYVESEHLFFAALLHLSTLIAIAVVYRKTLLAMFSDTINFFSGHGNAGRDEGGRFSHPVRTTFMTAIATIPLIVGAFFYSKIAMLGSKTGFVGLALIASGALVYALGRVAPGHKSARTSTVADALIIGVSQAIALVPGLSRTAATVSAASLRDYKRNFAVTFSFVLLFVAEIGAFILNIYNAFRIGVDWALLPVYIVGFVFATVIAWLAIFFLRWILARDKLDIVAYYCCGIGLITLIVSIFI